MYRKIVVFKKPYFYYIITTNKIYSHSFAQKSLVSECMYQLPIFFYFWVYYGCIFYKLNMCSLYDYTKWIKVLIATYDTFRQVFKKIIITRNKIFIGLTI